MKERFTPWEVKFDINLDIEFDIKTVMIDEDKIAQNQLIGPLMASEQKVGFSS